MNIERIYQDILELIDKELEKKVKKFKKLKKKVKKLKKNSPWSTGGKI